MIKNEEFEQLVYMAHGSSGSGSSLEDALPLADASLSGVLEAGAVVTNAEVIVLEAVTGSTAVDVGDGSDPDGYVEAADITLGTPGAYAGAGALLPDYSAAAKSLEISVTDASTAGSLVVVLRGYRV